MISTGTLLTVLVATLAAMVAVVSIVSVLLSGRITDLGRLLGDRIDRVANRVDALTTRVDAIHDTTADISNRLLAEEVQLGNR